MSGASPSPYRAGFVVVRRNWQPLRRGHRLPTRYGFTLHREGCPRLSSPPASRAQPAPAEPYPGTVACATCRPDDPHHYGYTPLADGRVRGTCTACPITVQGSKLKVAQINMHRAHEVARSAELMAAALARGPVPRVATARLRGADWTLHTSECGYVRRAAVVRPAVADEDIPPLTVACNACRPAGAPVALEHAPDTGTAHALTRHRDAGATRYDKTRITCSCGADTGIRANDNAARQALRRIHGAQFRAQRQRIERQHREAS